MNTGTNELIATALAHADEHQQALVLNEFVDTLIVLCKHGGGLIETSAGTQGHFIAKHLRRKTVEFFREMVGSYDYLQQQTETELAEARLELEQTREQIKNLREAVR